MANGRNADKRIDSGRMPGGFVALPWCVLDCSAYKKLSHPARSLLMEIARQFVRDNNGRLLASSAYLKKRGWNSTDVITRAKRELLDAGFIHETVKGHRPNKASWYAITWRTLDRLPGYDFGAAESFVRGVYDKEKPAQVIAKLRPSRGQARGEIAPSDGVAMVQPKPSNGAIRLNFRLDSIPSGGHHLDMPSAVVNDEPEFLFGGAE